MAAILACDTQNAKAIAAVRCQVDVEDSVIEFQVVTDRQPHRGILGQLEKPFRAFRKTEVLRGAQHPFGCNAAELRLTNPGSSRHDRADRRERRSQACGRVRRATDDGVLRVPVVDPAEHELVRIRMWLDSGDLGDDEAVERGRGSLHRVDLQAGDRQLFGEIVGFQIDIDPITEPLNIDAHPDP